jgi:polyisoprenyl-phosphate glycosyltransferase
MANKNTPIISIVVPCFNESEVLRVTCESLLKVLDDMSKSNKSSLKSFIVFVDDGSTDDTWNIIEHLSQDHPWTVRGLKLSRNFGHQAALLAGIRYSYGKCDCSISIDADLQQDEQVIEKFVDDFLKGSDIVFGVRNDRQSDTFFKKLTAIFFYRFAKKMGIELIENHADYRLLSAKIMGNFRQYREVNLFLRGIFPVMGFNTSIVKFDVKQRLYGHTKYSLRKMLGFAWGGITSFSVAPLRLVTVVGLSTAIISVLMSAYVLFQAVFTKNSVPGWASTVLPIYFIGGIQMCAIGLLGEYMAVLYKEVKRRPLYHVDKQV